MKKSLIYLCFLLGAGPVAAQQGVLTVQEYKQRVLDYSQQIKQSAEQRNALQQAIRIAKSSQLPQLDFSGSVQYRINDYDLDMMGAKLSMAHETYSLEAGVTQSVYQGGMIRNSIKAAEIQHEIAQKAEELTVENVLYAADVNYWATTAKKDLYLVVSEYVRIIEQLEGVVKERFNDGLISKTDMLQVQSRLKDAELQKSEASKAYQIALQNLNVLMGSDPMAPIDVVDSISIHTEAPTLMSLDEALVRRPDFHIADLGVSYQDRQISLARSKFNPNLAVGLKESWGTTMLNFDGSTMFNTNAFASLNVPIFHGGGRRKNVAYQQALLRSKEYDRQITRDQISQELSNAWTNLTENTRQIGVAEEACTIAAENLELNTFSYNEGKLPIIDVLTAQVTWIQAYSGLIQTWLQQKISLADYLKATSTLQ